MNNQKSVDQVLSKKKLNKAGTSRPAFGELSNKYPNVGKRRLGSVSEDATAKKLKRVEENKPETKKKETFLKSLLVDDVISDSEIEDNTNNEKEFKNGQIFFQDIDEKNKSKIPILKTSIEKGSQISTNFKIKRRVSNVFYNESHKHFKTLVRRRFKNELQFNTFESEKEYTENFINYLLSNEVKHILRKNFLTMHNMSISERIAVINWLLKIQQHFEIDENIYFTAIYIIDKCWSCVKERSNYESRLMATTALWSVSKYYGNCNLWITKVHSLLEGKFSISEIKEMERKILKLAGFTYTIPEPDTFMYYLMSLLNIDNKKITNGIFFVLECMSMFPAFSCIPCSHLTISAFYITMHVLKDDIEKFKKTVTSMDLITVSNLDKICNKIIIPIINFVTNSSNEFNEPFVKYSSEQRNSVSNEYINLKMVPFTL